MKQTRIRRTYEKKGEKKGNERKEKKGNKILGKK